MTNLDDTSSDSIKDALFDSINDLRDSIQEVINNLPLPRSQKDQKLRELKAMTIRHKGEVSASLSQIKFVQDYDDWIEKYMLSFVQDLKGLIKNLLYERMAQMEFNFKEKIKNTRIFLTSKELGSIIQDYKAKIGREFSQKEVNLIDIESPKKYLKDLEHDFRRIENDWPLRKKIQERQTIISCTTFLFFIIISILLLIMFIYLE